MLRAAQAIMVYLAKKYGSSGQWYPDDAEALGTDQPVARYRWRRSGFHPDAGDCGCGIH
jgi:glutathione S-transferase